jgi:hypothetical protein
MSGCAVLLVARMQANIFALSPALHIVSLSRLAHSFTRSSRLLLTSVHHLAVRLVNDELNRKWNGKSLK